MSAPSSFCGGFRTAGVVGVIVFWCGARHLVGGGI